MMWYVFSETRRARRPNLRRGEGAKITRSASKRDAQRLDPAQSLIGGGARLVLASDPAVVAQGVHGIEDNPVSDLAFIGFVAARHGGDLDMPDLRKPLFKPRQHVAL